MTTPTTVPAQDTPGPGTTPESTPSIPGLALDSTEGNPLATPPPAPGNPSSSIPAPRPGSRAMRARTPIAPDVLREAAITAGVCINPITLKVTDTLTGEVTLRDVPCGATMDHKCPVCAEKARKLRMTQCRTGWHLDTDPLPAPDAPTGEHVRLATLRADLTADLTNYLTHGDTSEIAEIASCVDAVDSDLRAAGVRGNIDPPKPQRRTRSTRRRQDAPDLPKRPMQATTLGRRFTDTRTGRAFRPSMFITLSLPSYGRVHGQYRGGGCSCGTKHSGEDPILGAPVDPEAYDYVSAARDALHFGKLIDRFIQNLRRVAGYDVQYFAAVEPQRRGAPHVHLAIRGTIPRALLRQVIAATYHQVWWPTLGEAVYTPEHAPVWTVASDGTGRFVDPDTRAPITTWDEALDALDTVPEVEPAHVVRFGTQADIQGLLAGTPQADRRIGYLTKYLTKSMADAHNTTGHPAQAAHADRLAEVLAIEPCSPGCANWLRYGIAPRGAHHGMAPGSCRSKAHKREHLGYGGRRILVSRKWSGKTLADHKADRRAFVLAVLGLTPGEGEGTEGGGVGGVHDMTRDRYTWQPVDPRHDHVAPLSRRLLLAIAERDRWRTTYRTALAALGVTNSATESGSSDRSATADTAGREAG